MQYPLDVMAGVGGTGKTVDVIAFHCYEGGVENQTVFHNAYPETPMSPLTSHPCPHPLPHPSPIVLSLLPPPPP